MANKRANHEGTIFQLKDGRWAAEISLGWEKGKRKRKRLVAKTQREVRERLTKLRRELDQGIPVVDEKVTVGQFLDRWLESSVKPRLRPKTVHSYSQHVELHLKPTLGKTPLAKLSPQQVQQLLSQKLEDGLSPRTVSGIRAVLRAALTQATKWGFVQRNVATLVDPPPFRRFKPEPFSLGEAKTYLAALKGDRDEALFTLTLFLGLRLGEVLGLSWDDISFENETIRIENALQRIEGELSLVATKTEKSRRTIPLPAHASRVLSSHKARQASLRMKLGQEWSNDLNLVFTTDRGTPLDPDNIRRKHYFVIKRAKLRRIRFHDLRHSCATFLAEQGIPARVAMELLGHSEIRTTLEIYSHVRRAALQKASDALNEILSG